MKLNQKGALDMMLVAAIAVVLIVGGFVVYRISDSEDASSDDSAANSGEVSSYEECVTAGGMIMLSYPEQCRLEGGSETWTRELTDEEQERTNPPGDNVPDGSGFYENADYRFSFTYPEEWGTVSLSEPSLGSETEAGPRSTLTFSCESCDDLPAIALNSRDFGGIGTGAPLPFESGFAQNEDGSYTVYIFDNQTKQVSPDDVIAHNGSTDILMFREFDDVHNQDHTRAVANLAGEEYKGLAFRASDEPGETTNSEVLVEVIESIILQ